MTTQTFDWRNLDEKKLCYDEASRLVESDYREFWRREAHRLQWQKTFSSVHDGKFAEGQWFGGGMLNASENCLDRHVDAGRGEHVAITFENEAGQVQNYTYRTLLDLTCHIATMLDARGIKSGDRVAIYMPMSPEAVASMLACARLGVVHTVVFAGFSKDALCERIFDSNACAIITSGTTVRKGATIGLQKTVEDCLADPRSQSVTTVLCFQPEPSSDARLQAFAEQASWPVHVQRPRGFAADHPLFILYTSGTTGKPKGIFHGTGGYLTQTLSTTKWVFDLTHQDKFWCTADVGWITGHTYIAYGPLMLGSSLFIYEGALNYPTPARIYQLIGKHQVSVLYTAPTAIRMFMRTGEEAKGDANLRSLRLLGSVGEPINPEAWRWYSRVFGNDQCPIVDTWWQTETGSMMIAPIPHISNQKPGSASAPLLGIKAKIVDEQGEIVVPEQSGFLVIERSWPSLACGIWNDLERFHKTYFSQIEGAYFTGDGASIDREGNFTISGRIDDVVNVSGHRLGTAEVESALVSHKTVAEAAVVGVPDDITGQKIVAFVTLKNGQSPSKELELELMEHVKMSIGSFAKPKTINFQNDLPKTRSGKIMRRLLRSIASGEKISSDISTLDSSSTFKL